MTNKMFTPAVKEKLKARVAFDGPTGSGKALRFDQPVLTPTGWVPIGDLDVGDQVIGSAGMPVSVTGVYPQGVRDLFEVVCSDGTVVVADGDHLWATQDRYARGDGRPARVRTTADIMDSLTVGQDPRPNHYLPMPAPIEFDRADLPLDPYLLGVLLGDGCLRTGGKKNGVSIASADDEILAAVAKALPDPCRLIYEGGVDYRVSVGNIGGGGTNPLTAALRSLDLLGRYSHEKHVPSEYLFAAPEQRLALLQGLFDSDGHASGYTLEFTSGSRRLADDVRFLVQSFGGTVTTTSRFPGYRHGSESRIGRESWRIYVKLPGGIEPFKLTRKLAAYTPRTKYQPWRQIVDVRPVEPGLAVCISVDAPDSLFLTAGCVPTHNTWTAHQWARILAGPDGRIGTIDTENRSAAYYAPTPGVEPVRTNFYDPPYEFGHLSIDPPFDPRQLRKMIQQAEGELGENGVLIIDSLSHYWEAEGGTLDIVDDAAARSYGGNRFAGWKEGTPAQRDMLEAIVRAPFHVICTMRSKQEWVLETTTSAGGKESQKPKKVGMKPVQRDGVEYEFTVVADMDLEHRLVVSKSRCSLIADVVMTSGRSHEPALLFAEWLASGVERLSAAQADGLAALFDVIDDQAARREAKRSFIAEFGKPAELLTDQLFDAREWIEGAVAGAKDVAPASDQEDVGVNPGAGDTGSGGVSSADDAPPVDDDYGSDRPMPDGRPTSAPVPLSGALADAIAGTSDPGEG